jgi:serine/threonine-protein kinase
VAIKLLHPRYAQRSEGLARFRAEARQAGGPLESSRTMDIVAQAAAGLQAAHAAGMIHRDIKPGNLLLAPGGTVKITDFGIAHTIGSASVTASGELIGTPGYLAPERAEGEQATPASDLYSLGMVAYECLADAAPPGHSPVTSPGRQPAPSPVTQQEPVSVAPDVEAVNPIVERYDNVSAASRNVSASVRVFRPR